MPLELYRRGKIWHYRGTVAGRRLRGSTKTADKATAQVAAAKVEDEAWKCHHFGPQAVLTFAQAAIAYRAAEKPHRFLDAIEDHWKDTPVRSITPGAIRQAAIKLLPRAKGSTRNRNVIVPTQAIINHAASLGLCQPLKVERFSFVVKPKTPATWEWIERFMAVASPHLGALACFMFLTGARISEALEVRWKDVDLAARRATIRQGKLGGVERRAHLPQPLVVALANIPGERHPDAKVFGYSSRDTAKPVWRAACKRAGIEPLSYHCCRHGFATAMLHAGVDPITTAKLGGWKDPRHVFATYGHPQGDDTLAERIIGTRLAQPEGGEPESIGRKRA